ncbi:MAG: hypothetical protein HY904_02075 [Deltaproteobacteria bacterium]|nr:hypothetical protein [Deltaproteobacteria bacterium]
MTAGAGQTCARTGDGKLYCWGANQLNQVGPNAASGVEPRPTEVPGLQGGTLQSAAGQHTCATAADGGVLCWGGNQVGQCGVDTTVATVVVQPSLQPLAGVTALGGGGLASCVLAQASGVYCWGAGAVIPVGAFPLPHHVAGTGYQDVVNGASHACLRRPQGSVECWGANGNHQVNETDTGQFDTPLDVPTAGGADAIAAGANFTCVLKGTQVYCWGANDRKQLAREDAGPPAGALLIPGVAARRVAAGGSHACVVTTTGRVVCWGDNGQKQCGQEGPATLPAPAEVPTLTNVVDVVAGGGFSCARVADAGVYCWGGNQSGALGRPAGPNDAVPQPVQWPVD